VIVLQSLIFLFPLVMENGESRQVDEIRKSFNGVIL
jgi:hypothetical protein